MIGRIFSRCSLKESYVKSIFELNLRGSLNHRSYSTAQRMKLTTQESFKEMKTKLNPQQSKQITVKSFEEFRNSSHIKAILGDDVEKISSAYKDYVLSRSNRYQRSIYGGNPANML